MYGVLMTTDPAEIVKTAIDQLSTNVGAVIPAALTLSVTVFGAIFLWKKAKGIVSA